MSNGHRGIVWTIIGSVIIAIGSTLAGLYAFADRIGVVMLGFLIFIGGYRISQLGMHSDIRTNTGVFSRLSNVTIDGAIAIRVCLLVLGWAGIATGVTLFSQTILDPSISSAVVSGVSSIGGYMCAHVGINGVGLGDSIFGPILAYFQGPAEGR